MKIQLPLFGYPCGTKLETPYVVSYEIVFVFQKFLDNRVEGTMLCSRDN